MEWFFGNRYYYRQVSQEEGKEMAEQWNSPTVETSAKHNENVGK